MTTKNVGTAESKLKPKLGSKAICRDWLSRCTDITTLHGFPWYNRFESIAVKVFIIVACFGFTCAMSGYSIHTILVWYHSKVRLTSETIKVVNELQYPNITLCHSKYFDMSKAEAKGISNELANYMTTLFDFGFAPLVLSGAMGINGLSTDVNETLKRLTELEAELLNILDRDKTTILDLYKSIAIGCEDFIQMCEFHYNFLLPVPEENFKSRCCSQYFNKEPIFTSKGVCYTTNQKLIEEFPYQFSGLEIWATLSHPNISYPNFEVNYKGSQSMRESMYFMFTYQNEIPINLEKKVNSIESNKLNQISMRSSKETKYIRECRKRRLELFPQDTVWPYDLDTYTPETCQYFYASTFDIFNCSFTEYYGLKRVSPKKICTPMDMLQGVKDQMYKPDAKTRQQREHLWNEVCWDLCERTRTEFTISVESINATRLEKIGIPVELSQNQFSAARFYYESFEVKQLLIQTETIFQVLSRIGGIAGLVMGASFISIFELICMFLMLFRGLCKGCL